jgi:hypothetical protein
MHKHTSLPLPSSPHCAPSTAQLRPERRCFRIRNHARTECQSRITFCRLMCRALSTVMHEQVSQSFRKTTPSTRNLHRTREQRPKTPPPEVVNASFLWFVTEYCRTTHRIMKT